MAAKRNEDYDWLNDPFDEKKAAREREEARMSMGAKMGLGCGCALVVLIVMGLLLFGSIQVISLL